MTSAADVFILTHLFFFNVKDVFVCKINIKDCSLVINCLLSLVLLLLLTHRSFIYYSFLKYTGTNQNIRIS